MSHTEHVTSVNKKVTKERKDNIKVRVKGTQVTRK